MRNFILLVMLSIGFAVAASAERPEVSRYVKAYRGGEGIAVRVLRVGPNASQEALVQITGVDHRWDGRIQKMHIEPTQRGVTYILASEGKRLAVLNMEEARVELLAPTLSGPTPLSYDRELSQQGNAQHFLSAYLEQR
jgi:hypothetical protein